MSVRNLLGRLNSFGKRLCTMVILCGLLSVSRVASTQATCSPTPITPQEARQLLHAIPQAKASQRIGGAISIVDWTPGAGYRTERFYLFEVLSTKSTTTTPLDNGVIGYFGVNKATGQIVELNSEAPSVEGKQLRRLQDMMRAKHCVSDAQVKENSALSLEK